ncbi:MAG: PilZ domain-containing protein [Leptospiraceae bacterium]|nr:PilZ domain-containing protein [Leptospiraceae bacterium]MCP5497836.1 PilZ domain-containing protein [Leptospiraceae bacterium]
MKYHEPFYLPHKVFGKINITELIFLITSFLSGLGLLMIRRWGWYLFVVATTAFFIHNGYYFIKYPSTFSKGPLLHSIIVLFAFLYFLQKDIFLPYLDKRRKGFRHAKRYPIQIPVTIQGEIHEAINISIGGISVYWTNIELPLNAEVSLSFEIEGETFKCKGGIVAIQKNNNVGIAFRELDKRTIQRLKRCIKNYK